MEQLGIGRTGAERFFPVPSAGRKRNGGIAVRNEIRIGGNRGFGLPVNPLTGNDNDGDSYSFDRPREFGRIFRAPMQATLDVSLSKQFNSAKSSGPRRALSSQLLNRNNYITVNNVPGKAPRRSPPFSRRLRKSTTWTLRAKYSSDYGSCSSAPRGGLWPRMNIRWKHPRSSAAMMFSLGRWRRSSSDDVSCISSKTLVEMFWQTHRPRRPRNLPSARTQFRSADGCPFRSFIFQNQINQVLPCCPLP